MIDWDREYAEVYGLIGVRFTQDGRYFNGRGEEIFPTELFPRKMEMPSEAEPKEPEPEPLTEYSKKTAIMAELTRLGISFNPRQKKHNLWKLLQKITTEEE